MKNKKLENLKDKPTEGKHGGVRLNSGRPKGSQNKATKEKVAIEEELKQKIMGSVSRLFSAQMNLAEGVTYLYKIEKDSKGKNKRPELVTSKAEIEQYLSDDTDTSAYYYISTERPDNRAIDSMLNRVFGPPKQDIGVEGSLTVVIDRSLEKKQ